MSASEHDRDALGAFALGGLDADEARRVGEHLAGCAECRDELAELNELKDLLGEVPPEAFLDGPPDDDMLLQRTLRQVRAESAGLTAPAETAPADPGPVGADGRWTGGARHAAGGSGGAGGAEVVPLRPRPARRLLLVAAALLAVVGAGVVGGLIGRDSVEPVAITPVTPPPVPGQKTVKATDAKTGTAITATVIPKAGWVTIKADVRNLPVGAQCELRVIDNAGHSKVAGSWLVSEKTSKEGSLIDGGALIPLDKVKSIDVVTFQGQKMVSVPV